MPESTSLLPCPFCGKPAQRDHSRDPVKIGCFNPECIKPKASSTDENYAARRWNTRAVPQNPALSTQNSTPVWIPAAQLPDDETTVIIHCPNEDEPIWLGYHDGDDGWRTVEGCPIKVSAWMHLPEPPEAK